MVDNSYDPLFNYAGQQYNVDPALLRTVFRNESNENANTKPSTAGALGGMQMLPDTARAYGAPDPTDMRMAIPAAAIYLRKALDTYGSPEAALAAYHGGFDTTQWGPKTMAYVQKGIDNYPQVRQDMINAAVNTSTPLSAPMPAQATPPPIDPDVAAGAKLMSAPPSTSMVPTPTDPDVLAGQSLIANIPKETAPPVETPEAPPSPTGDVGMPMPTPEQATNLGNTIANMPANVSANATNWMNQPPTPGFNRSSILPIAVNPDVKGLGGLQLDFHGPVNAMANMFEQNSPQAVAARGNITPDMALTLMRPGLAGAANPLMREAVANRIAQVSDRARQQAVTPLTDAEVAPGLGSVAPVDATAVPSASVAPGPSEAVPLSQATTGPNAAPNSVGAAATPTSLIPALTPAEAATAEGKQFQQTAIDRQDSGQDPTQYVPNSTPTLGTINPSLSPEENALRSHSPQAFKAVDDANNAARVDYFDSHTSDPIAMEQLTQARDAQATQDLTAAFSNKTPVDVQPLVDTIDSTLASGGNKRTVVKNTLNNVKNSLYQTGADGSPILDAAGNPMLETDPQILYAARQNITDMLAKGKTDPSSDEALAASHLNDIKTQLDGLIEQGAPGYQQYLKNFQQNSMPIDQAQVLANMRSKIVNGQGNMLLNPLNQQLANIVKARAAPGISPAKSLTPDTMDMLFNLKADLQRKAYSDSMNQGVGSNTVRNAIQAAKAGVLNPITEGILHAGIGAASAYMGPAGFLANPLLRVGANKMAERRIGKANAAIEDRVQQFTNPGVTAP